MLIFSSQLELQLHSLSPAQGGAQPQRFIPYVALNGNALQDDGRVAGRKDKQFTVSGSGQAVHMACCWPATDGEMACLVMSACFIMPHCYLMICSCGLHPGCITHHHAK